MLETYEDDDGCHLDGWEDAADRIYDQRRADEDAADLSPFD